MKRFIIIIFIISVFLGLSACTEEHTLIGKWKTELTQIGEVADVKDSYAVLEFCEDGTGMLTEIVYDEGYKNNFTYTINGNALVVYTDSGKTIECEYKINGEKLIISTHYMTNEYIRLSD